MKTLNGMIGRAMAWTAMLAMALSVGGCSDSDSDGPGDVTFPEKDAITVNAGQDRTLTFSADAEWKLTSNASWCPFRGRGFRADHDQRRSGRPVGYDPRFG